MDKQQIADSVERCLSWMENQMLTFNRGSCGVYERIRINIGQRVCWTRPDCTSEMARVLLLNRRLNRDENRTDIYENFVSWLLKVQDTDELSVWYGSFPFYLFDGWIEDATGNARYQNDNGKVLIALLDMYEETKDSRLLACAEKLAGYWMGMQLPEGTYFRRDRGVTQSLYKGPCFLFWLIAGLAQCAALTGKEVYRKSARQALQYVLPLQKENGRFTTTYEIHKSEDWRPVSSESAIALFCLARVMRYDPCEVVRTALERVLQFLLTLQHKSGAIVNCSPDSLGASLQEEENLCDLVYTEGFALMGFTEAYRVLGDSRSLEAAKKLGSFLMNIQCRGESPLWDGAWRGSYDVEKECWAGRADQNNPIDEGGMYSVYTGWCNAPNMYGLLQLESLL